MAKRYTPLGKDVDRLFAKAARGEADAQERGELLAREEEEIARLSDDPVFRSWAKRIFREMGGMLNSALKDDAAQAQGLTLYCVARDLARTDAGRRLVSEIVLEHFGMKEGRV